MVQNAGFFKPSVPSEKSKQSKNKIVFVGGDLFHAAAVGLLDALKRNSMLGSDTVKKLLGAIYQHFPKHIDNQAYLTPFERLSRLLTYPRKSELVECVAYVLRQLTLNEIKRDFLNIDYRPLFAQLKEESLHDCREPQVLLPACVFAALAKVLEVDVSLSIEESEKDLAKKQSYSHPVASTGIHKKITLHLKDLGGKYGVAVNDPAYFAHVGQLAVPLPEPEKKLQAFNKQTLGQEITEIKKADERLVAQHEQCFNALKAMLVAGEFKKKNPFLEQSSWLAERSDHARYVDKLVSQRVGANTPLIPQLELLLAGALASMVAVNQLSEQELFDTLVQQAPVGQTASL